ncbi:hypothetical protein LCGC14_0165330 [marine sediment metagenome]|uniref:Spore protein YkvP/CgeB glycosyl transferase-like domain-containing protein n=1 Tax=marine sediment metagenome TaxID=412755 RepID=A0A0F9UYT3_9ZZZZ
MKILTIGGNRVAQSLKSAVHGLELFGDEVESCLPRRVFQNTHDHDQVFDLVRDSKPSCYDAVLFWNPKREMPLNIVQWVTTQVPTVYWTVDDPNYEEAGSPVRRACSATLTCCQDSVDRYEKEGQPAALAYPPVNVKAGAYDLMTYDPAWACDVSFMAGNAYRMSEFPKMYADRPTIADRLIREGFDFMAFGHWDQKSGGWGRKGIAFDKAHYGGFVHPDSNTLFYRTCAINLNSHVRPDGLRYYNERLIHCLGSGGFMLCDKVNGIELDFTPGEHLDVWSSLDELVEKVRFYLENPEKRKAIALQAALYVTAKFSNIEFARTLHTLVKRIR